MSATEQLTAPGNPDPRTVEAYRRCREIARSQAQNFYWAFRVLPQPKSDAMCAVYAFMRRADDISDDESKSLDARRAEMAAWLAAWRAARASDSASSAQPFARQQPLSAQVAGIAHTSDTSDAAVFLALADTQRRFQIPDALLEELVAGTTMDLEPRADDGPQTYATFDDLYRYCYLVASVVGLVCIRIFGYTDPRAEQFAEETGVAFQLTNILRDVKEDIERGRVYLPIDLLDEFGETIPELRELAASNPRPMTQRERGMLATLAIRAEKYYLAANKLIPLLDRDSRAAMWVLVTIYHRLLARIADRKMEVFDERISLSTGEKLTVLLRGAVKAACNRVLG